jgi:hypothetical protein
MASTTYNSMDLFQGNLHRKLAGVYRKYGTPPFIQFLETFQHDQIYRFEPSYLPI